MIRKQQNEAILVDRGRGPQLPHSRITIHDLVPYFQARCLHAEIMRWIPSLDEEEIAVLEDYYRQHKGQLDEHEGRVQAYRAEQIQLQRLRFPEPEGTRDERLARLKRLLQRRCQGNGREGDRG
jgi:hypothetical protein